MPWSVTLNCPGRFGAYEHSRKLHEWSQEKRRIWKEKISQRPDYDVAFLIAASEAAERQRALELVNYSEPQVSIVGSCLVTQENLTIDLRRSCRSKVRDLRYAKAICVTPTIRVLTETF